MITIKIGTRPSPLAVKQARDVECLLSGIGFEIIKIETKGDRDKTTPLSKIEGTDFFTGDIEKALLAGGIDAAVHSAKDLEGAAGPGLIIAAVTPSISPHDCLVSRSGRTLDALPAGSVIGTSSRARKEAVSEYRGGLILKDIRGGIDERLAQLDEGKFDAVIIAHAALIRLGYEDRICEILPDEIFRPHPLQGKLAVQIKEERADLLKLFEGIDEKRKG